MSSSVSRSLTKLAAVCGKPTSAKTMLSTLSASPLAPALPDLPFKYNALEPFISGEIMEIHHTKHHQTYVTNLAAALEQLDAAIAAGDVSRVIALQDAVRFNGGGHVNHSIFWTNLAPHGNGGGGEPEGALAEAINAQWGDFETFKSTFNAKTVAVQGSGWGWLGYNKDTDKLEIATCANQDPLSTKNLVPLLGVDVWEHAYYLQYKNVRPDYLKAVWEVVNLGNVAERFEAARS